MRHTSSLAVVVLALLPWSSVSANPLRRFFALDRVNRRIGGQILDYTNHHGADRRLWSAALQEKRDLYVYLPPDFNPDRQYPLLLWLHGFAQDESVFLSDVIMPLDAAILEGRLPPVIIAAPDGSVKGTDCFWGAGSFFLNSEAGRFEDFLMIDVWNFLMCRFPIRPEREAHAIVGVSMGGGAAFNKAIKFSNHFSIAVGLFPPLNLRWQDCHGRYRAPFDPCCWGWRTDYVHRHTLLARFYGIPIRLKTLLDPLYGRRNPETLPALIRNNPIEMLDLYDVRPGQLQMYAAYGGQDQFNIAAQVESFLFVARRRGLVVDVGYEPNGKHNRATANRLLTGIIDWLGHHLAPFAPDGALPPCR